MTALKQYIVATYSTAVSLQTLTIVRDLNSPKNRNGADIQQQMSKHWVGAMAVTKMWECDLHFCG
jgi:hypothetical protein